MSKLVPSALLIGALLVPSGASGAEIVSKLPGPDGLPIPAQLIDASSDGRYVLLRAGIVSSAPEPTGPEADPLDVGYYLVRDRIADTTTPLEFHLEPGGDRIYNVEAFQISDDGDRVLVAGPELHTFVNQGEIGQPTAVYDRSEDRMLRLPSAPGGVVYPRPRLSADGTKVLFRTSATRATSGVSVDYPWFRGAIGGAATQVVSLPNAEIEAASADLQTLIYSRDLLPAKRPVEDYPRSSYFYANVIGVVTGDQPPRILAEESYAESPTAGSPTCTPESGITTDERRLGAAYVSPNASRAGWLEYGNTGPATLKIRAAGGATTSQTLSREGYSRVLAFGNANQVVFDSPPGAGYVQFSKELVKGDTEVIGSAFAYDWDGGSAYTTRYVTAEPFAGVPVPDPAPLTFTDEPVDTASRTSVATWYSCPAGSPSAPVGAFEDYVRQLSLYKPYSAKYNIGNAIFRSAPSASLRPASKITAEVTVAGLPYWKKTVLGSSAYASFPKPLAWLPLTLKISVQFAAAPGQPAPAPLTRAYSIYTTKTN